MADRQYSIEKVQASWAGLNLKEGIAVGTSIKESRNAKTWSSKDTGTGDVVYVKNPSKSGKLTITIDLESKLHQQLGALAIADETLMNIVFPFVITDESTGEVFTYTNTRIESQPDESRGTEAGTIDWVFLFAKRTKIPNAGNKNVVGA